MATTATYDVNNHEVVAHDEWIAARRALMAKEKEFTRRRDELSKARRDLPWERVEKNYVFDSPQGKVALADAFDGQSQLVVYHFMYAPEWDEGCKSCSFWAENFERNVVHLRAHDVALVAVSRAPVATLEAYKKRMGWTFRWLSSGENDFNYDYGVSFRPERSRAAEYNYAPIELDEDDTDLPGISVFYKADNGTIYHTYSTYGRGIDLMNAAYNYIDLTPKGRLDYGRPMWWLKRRDEY